MPWDYRDVVRGLLTGKETVLDMGCGNGKVLAALADRFRRGIGIDISKERVDEARLSLPMKLRSNVHFTRASAHAVPAPDDAFHAVLNRQAALFPEEIDRVLSPGGVFVTQQVGRENTRAIMAAFEEARGPLPLWPEEFALPRTFSVLSSLGYELVRRDEYDVPYLFEDAASLLYWLQRAPVPQDFDIERDAETVLEILDRLGTPQGIVTNEHRELLAMRKRD
ncbi:MAG: class I SAM-dependent methyltransferase [Chloroflexi bacterium]|nr:class I SAM-dependent methyltransferase [Chloroflexota bacterium]